MLTVTRTLWALPRISIGSQYQSWTHRRAGTGTRPRRFPAAFIPNTVSPHFPEIVDLFVIGGFLMSPFKIFNYFFLHVLQGSVRVEFFLKQSAVECKNAFENLNILKQKELQESQVCGQKLRCCCTQSALHFPGWILKIYISTVIAKQSEFLLWFFCASLSLHTVLMGKGGASVYVCMYISLYTYVRLSLAQHYKRLGKILLPTELKIK